MSLRRPTETPPAFTTQHTHPGVPLWDTPTAIELPDRVTPLELFQSDHSYLPAHPFVESFQLTPASGKAEVVQPSYQKPVQSFDLILQLTGTVASCQSAYPLLKTVEALPGDPKTAVLETGGSRGASVRSHGLPPSSPYSRAV